MATLIKRPVRAVGTISGNQPQMRVYDLASGVDLYAGDLVRSLGGALERAASPVAVNNTLLGLLVHDAKQGTPWYLGSSAVNAGRGGTYGGTFMGRNHLLRSIDGIGGRVALANDDTIFEISEEQALGISLLGDAVTVLRDTTGADANIWYSNSADATAESAIIIAIPSLVGQAIGDTFARVWIQFLPDASAVF